MRPLSRGLDEYIILAMLLNSSDAAASAFGLIALRKPTSYQPFTNRYAVARTCSRRQCTRPRIMFLAIPHEAFQTVLYTYCPLHPKQSALFKNARWLIVIRAGLQVR